MDQTSGAGVFDWKRAATSPVPTEEMQDLDDNARYRDMTGPYEFGATTPPVPPSIFAKITGNADAPLYDYEQVFPYDNGAGIEPQVTWGYPILAQSTLANAISDVATTLGVVSATGFPVSAPFYILVDEEVMEVTGVSGTTFTVTRAAVEFDGEQIAVPHATGAYVNYIIFDTSESVLAGTDQAIELNGDLLVPRGTIVTLFPAPVFYGEGWGFTYAPHPVYLALAPSAAAVLGVGEQYQITTSQDGWFFDVFAHDFSGSLGWVEPALPNTSDLYPGWTCRLRRADNLTMTLVNTETDKGVFGPLLRYGGLYPFTPLGTAGQLYRLMMLFDEVLVVTLVEVPVSSAFPDGLAWTVESLSPAAESTTRVGTYFTYTYYVAASLVGNRTWAPDFSGYADRVMGAGEPESGTLQTVTDTTSYYVQQPAISSPALAFDSLFDFRTTDGVTSFVSYTLTNQFSGGSIGYVVCDTTFRADGSYFTVDGNTGLKGVSFGGDTYYGGIIITFATMSLTPGDWMTAVPTSQQEFNNRISAAVAGLLGGPIP